MALWHAPMAALKAVMSGFSCTSCICFNKCKAICHWDLRVGGLNSRNETKERGKRWTVYPPEVPFFLFILIRSAFRFPPKQTKGDVGWVCLREKMVLYDFSFKNHQISTTKNFPQEKNMFFFEPQKLKKKKKYAKAPMKDDPFRHRDMMASGGVEIPAKPEGLLRISLCKVRNYNLPLNPKTMKMRPSKKGS